ncbi:MAG: NADP-dependent isocitrate dehydrogenase [Deltaproteobacteria bacterium]|jgi:isocitrate dehydrogenase|nr:NADP-dependent isocitrate dehydrogenase [Deltaproteobacteria bacterium]
MTIEISYENGSFIAPIKAGIVKIEGDGVGPEIWRAAEPIFLEAAKKEGFEVVFIEALAGERAYQETGSALPVATLEALKKYRIGLKGPLGTPTGGGIRSLNVAIRKALDLYACVRPVKHIPGAPSPMKNPEGLDLLIFRENTEDVYAGLEWPANSSEAQKLIQFLRDELGVQVDSQAAIGLKPMSETNSKRLIRLALAWSIREKRPSLTLVHKGNIMKFTEGAFLKWGQELTGAEFSQEAVVRAEAKENDPRLIVKDCIADNMFTQVLLRPSEYSSIAAPNLNGDYLSDALAGQIGGLGLAPGANLGEGLGVFEATHGTVPARKGLDMVNPSSLLLSGAMAFDHIGWPSVGQRIRAAIGQTIKEGFMTYDLARLAGLNPIGTMAFGQAVLSRL